MELENNISNSNKVPGSPGGCDSFTRPEEIKALGKFLSNIKKVQEEHVKLDNSFHDITGKFPEIELEDKIEELRVEKLKNLSDKIISLETTSDAPLDRTLIGLDITKVDELEDTVISLEDNKTDELENTIVNLENDRVDELENVLVKMLDHDINKKPDIKNNAGPDIELSDSIEKITNINYVVDNLEDQVDILSIDKELIKLNQTTEKLDNLEEVNKLSDTIEILNNIENSELDLVNTVDRLNTNPKIDLSNFISELEIDNVVNLSNTIEDLDVNFDIKLSDSIINIDNEEVNTVELEDFKEKLENTLDNIGLDKDLLKLENLSTIDSLSDVKEDLKIDSEVKLNNTQVNLDIEFKDIDLGNEKIGIDNYFEFNSLEDFLDKIDNSNENIDLSDTINKLSVEKKEIGLEKERLNIEDNSNTELSNKFLTLENKIDNVELDTYKENLNILSEIPTLSKYIQKIEIDNPDIELESEYINLENSQTAPRREGDYDFFQNNREKSSETVLPGEKENILIPVAPSNDDDYFYFDPKVDGNKLYDSVLETPGDVIQLDNLETNKEILGEHKTAPRKLNADQDNYFSNEEPIGDKILPGDNINLLNPTAPENNSDKYKYLDIIKSGDDGELYEAIMNFTMLSSAAEKVNGVQVKGSMKGWINKIKSLVQTYLSPTKDKSGKYYIDIPENRAKQFEQGINNATKIALEVMKIDSLSNIKKDMPKYKLPEFNILGFNINDYLRYAAEEIIGFAKANKLGDRVREVLLKETLSLLIWGRDELEILTNAYRSRLPGNSGVLSDLMQGGLSVKSAANTVLDQFNTNVMNDPINRPTKDDNGNIKTIGWKKVNSREDNQLPVPAKKEGDENDSNGLTSKVGEFLLGGSEDINYNFFESYLNYGNIPLTANGETRSVQYEVGANLGMKTTLEDLVGIEYSEVEKCNSVEGLFELLNASSNITTVSNVTTDSLGNYKVMTLDSNNYWEITLEPYVGQLNGNYTFLPPISEAYSMTRELHGYNYVYTNWLPIVSFDLQKSKLVNKTLGLSDGEISYPTSIEYTNELRLTVVDDQYKTWRNYFELCMQSAVYSCNPKKYDPEEKKLITPDHLKKQAELYGTSPEIFATKVNHYVDGYTYIPEGINKTIIDKYYQLISPYKNITFLCKIYVMTPQKSTINKYELLLTLKDFSEERSGEIDGSGTDISLSFSIVGENPPREDKIKNTVGELIKTRTQNKDEAAEAEKKRKSGNLVAGIGGTLTSLI